MTDDDTPRKQYHATNGEAETTIIADTEDEALKILKDYVEVYLEDSMDDWKLKDKDENHE